MAWRNSTVSVTWRQSVWIATFSASPIISSRRSAASISVLLPAGVPSATSCSSLWQLVSTSCRRFAVRVLKEMLPLSFDHLPQVRIGDRRLGEEIDIAPEKRFERFGEREKTCRIAGRAIPKIDDEIEIARFLIERAGRARADEVEPVNAEIAAKRGKVLFFLSDKRDHRLLPGARRQTGAPCVTNA